MVRRTVMVAFLVVALVALVVPATAASAGSSKPRTPTLSGPITGGQGSPSLVGAVEPPPGYEREEYFLEGEATAYEPDGELGTDGKWTVTETTTAPYRTRIIVYRPADPDDFNGTVYVEWLNVTAGFDTAPDLISTHNQIFRSGAAWVGVSAQAVGVQGGSDVIEGATAGGLKGGDPERYGTLEHPGDSYAYDMFTQAGVAASGDTDGLDPLEGLDVKRVIALGESQSAFRMTTYVNAIQPLARVFDGFLIHSRGGSAAGFGDSRFSTDETIPDGVTIRRDNDVPVFTFETETDVTGLGFASARQPDSKQFRLWEVAGTAHADAYTVIGINDNGDGSVEFEVLDPAHATGGALNCSTSVNAGAQYAPLSASLAHLEKWVRNGALPPKQPRLETTGTGDAVAITRDELGLAVGGVRTPIVDEPIARNDGEENPGGSFCRSFGTTTPFDAATLAELYPDGSAQWQEAFAKAADKAVQDGIWLEPEADNFKAAAEQITFG